jgi:hypothetical protein
MDELLDESKREKYGVDEEHIAYIWGVLMKGALIRQLLAYFPVRHD